VGSPLALHLPILPQVVPGFPLGFTAAFAVKSASRFAGLSILDYRLMYDVGKKRKNADVNIAMFSLITAHAVHLLSFWILKV
jgi:hypothetical protein